jgi:fibronectin type 3 domain-containing protein
MVSPTDAVTSAQVSEIEKTLTKVIMLLTPRTWKMCKGLPITRSSLLATAVLAFLGIFMHTSIAWGKQVTLEWDANSEPNIAGYRVYFGSSSRNYDSIFDVGNETSCTISQLEEDEPYYFAVTAYDISAAESIYSNEACINCASESTSDSGGGGE